MKKSIFKAALFAAVALFAGYNLHNTQESEPMSEMVSANVEALADEEAGGTCQGGGLANTHCPIWSIEYTTSGWGGVTCSTGGSYKCEAGTCPHGK